MSITLETENALVQMRALAIAIADRAKYDRPIGRIIKGLDLNAQAIPYIAPLIPQAITTLLLRRYVVSLMHNRKLDNPSIGDFTRQLETAIGGIMTSARLSGSTWSATVDQAFKLEENAILTEKSRLPVLMARIRTTETGHLAALAGFLDIAVPK